MTPSREPDPRLFVELLFEVVVYEFEAIHQEIQHVVLSRIFQTFVEVSEEYQDLISCPCYDFIRDSDLLVTNESAWSSFISNFEPRLLPRFRPLRALEDHYFGYRTTGSGINLPTWSSRVRDHFQRRYDVFVPGEWKDDIAVFIDQLRTDLSIKGSGGGSIWCIQGKVQGIWKFSSHGVDQTVRQGEKLVLFAQEQEAIQKEQEAIQKEQEAVKDTFRIQDEDIQKQLEVIQIRQQEDTIRDEQQLLDDQKFFLSIYYELVIFELAADCGKGTKAGLQDPLRVVDFMKQHRPPWTITTREPVTIGSNREMSARVFEFTYNNRSRTEVVLPTLNEEDERAFLVTYDTTVPYSFKDDLAILVWEFQNQLAFRGSGGKVSTLHGGLQGMTKFTDMDAVVRYVLEQHDQERRQRLKQQETGRLEHDRSQKQSGVQTTGEEPEESRSLNAWAEKKEKTEEEEKKEEEEEDEEEENDKEKENGNQRPQSVMMGQQEQHLSLVEQAQGTTDLEQESYCVEEEAVEDLEEPQKPDPERDNLERLRLHYISKIWNRERGSFSDRRGTIFHYSHQNSRESWMYGEVFVASCSQ